MRGYLRRSHRLREINEGYVLPFMRLRQERKRIRKGNNRRLQQHEQENEGVGSLRKRISENNATRDKGDEVKTCKCQLCGTEIDYGDWEGVPE